MRANELLLWLSARREGSWQQFRAAVEEMNADNGESLPSQTYAEDSGEFPLHQQIRLDFERLAHVEFFACGCEDGWRVVPPTLAAQPISDGVRAVLCGARSPALRERLICAARSLDCETLNLSGVPDVLRFVASNPVALAELAEQTGLHFQPDAPLAILSHLPPCDLSSRELRRSEFPVGDGWDIRKFDASQLSWPATDRRDTQTARFGLFCFKDRFQPGRFFLRWKGETFEVRNHRVALYAMLRRNHQNVLRYDAPSRTLTMPAKCPPPALLDRALVLCSGMLPTYDAATVSLTYADVPMEIAHLAAELLRQPLR